MTLPSRPQTTGVELQLVGLDLQPVPEEGVAVQGLVVHVPEQALLRDQLSPVRPARGLQGLQLEVPELDELVVPSLSLRKISVSEVS